MYRDVASKNTLTSDNESTVADNWQLAHCICYIILGTSN